MSRFHLLAGLLAAANVGMSAYVVSLYTGATAAPESLRTLPADIAQLQDATGERVGPLVGAVVVLAFARASDESTLDMVTEIPSPADDDVVRVVLFSDQPSVVSAHVGSKGFSVVRSSRRDWLKLVDASSELESWSVYDERGVQRARGDFIGGGLEGAVGRLLGTTPEYSPRVVLAQLQRYFAKDGSSFVNHPSATPAHAVLFVGQLLSNCPIATALRTTDGAATESDGVSFSVLVPPDWSDQAITAMKANFSLNAPVRRAPAGVAAAWRNLQRTYGAAATAGFFVKFQPGVDPQVLTETEPILAFLGADAP